MSIAAGGNASKVLLALQVLLLVGSLFVVTTGKVLTYKMKVDSSGNTQLIGGSFEVKPLSELPSDTLKGGGVFASPYLYYLILVVSGIMILAGFLKPGLAQEVVVDETEFHQALASPARVQMLRMLGGKRMTLTEIAENVGLSLPGVKRHLTALEETGLVKKIDEGRKWKYYELTELGKKNLIRAFSRAFPSIFVSV